MDTNQFVKNLKSAVKSAPKSLILPETSDQEYSKQLIFLPLKKVAKKLAS